MRVEAQTVQTYYTPPEIARRFRCDVKKVLRWLATGELAGINLATNLKGRPRWRIHTDALTAFERSRCAIPKPESPRRRTRRAPTKVTQFFS